MQFVNKKELEKIPQDKRGIHKDASTKNLYLEFYPKKSGVSKTFYYRYRQDNKLYTINLGKYPETSLIEARAKANELNLKLLKKEDLVLDPAKTLKEIFEEWHKIAIKNKINQDFARPLELHIVCKYGNKPITDLTKQDIIKSFDKLFLENKRETIKRTYTHLKNLIKYALNRDYLQATNLLTLDIDTLYGKLQPKSFRAITDLDTFRDLLLAIDSYNGNLFVKTALQISPYLFLRSSTMRNLKWEYLDEKEKLLRIPASMMKAKEEFLVPLSQSVLDKILSIKDFAYPSPYMFPSEISKNKSIAENTLNYGLKRLGFGELMVYHGFRSTASTFLYENKNKHNQDSEVIELCLDHRERNKVKAVYNRSLRLEDRRALMQWWSDFIEELKKQK
ncbi:site-specific integrase [Campylobacter coli]|nr:site-specific integrase [Campylobacter coli]